MNTKTFLVWACYPESFPTGPERKQKIVFFALFYTTRHFSGTINYPITLKGTRAIGKAYFKLSMHDPFYNF